jgi:hypothetical protein
MARLAELLMVTRGFAQIKRSGLYGKEESK